MAKLTFHTTALNLILGGDKVGGNGIDLVGVGTAIPLDILDNVIYISRMSIHLTEVLSDTVQKQQLAA